MGASMISDTSNNTSSTATTTTTGTSASSSSSSSSSLGGTNKSSGDSASTAYSLSASSEMPSPGTDSKVEELKEEQSSQPVEGHNDDEDALVGAPPVSAASASVLGASPNDALQHEQEQQQQGHCLSIEPTSSQAYTSLTVPDGMSALNASASSITTSTVSLASSVDPQSHHRPAPQRSGSGWKRILRIASNANLRMGGGSSNKDNAASRGSSRTVSPSLSSAASFSNNGGGTLTTSAGGSSDPHLRYNGSNSSSPSVSTSPSIILPGSAGLVHSPTGSSLNTLASGVSTGSSNNTFGNSKSHLNASIDSPSAHTSSLYIKESDGGNSSISGGGYFAYPYTSTALTGPSPSNGPSPQPPQSRIYANGSSSSSAATSPSASMLFSSQNLSASASSLQPQHSPLAPIHHHSLSGNNSSTSASTSAQGSSSFSRSRSSSKGTAASSGKPDKYKGLGVSGPSSLSIRSCTSKEGASSISNATSPTRLHSPKGFFGRRKESSGNTLAPPPVFRLPSSPQVPTVSGSNNSSGSSGGRGLAKFLRRVSSAPSTKALLQQHQQANAAREHPLPEMDEPLKSASASSGKNGHGLSPTTSSGDSRFLSPNTSPTMVQTPDLQVGQSHLMSPAPTSASGKSLGATLPLPKGRLGRSNSHLAASTSSLIPPTATDAHGYASGSSMQKSASLQPPQSPKVVTRSRNGSYSRILDDGKYLPGGALAIPMPPSPSAGSLASSTYGLSPGGFGPIGTSTPPSPGGIVPTSPRQNFKRTYSSNSIKIRNVEVGPSSFQKIKLLGKGDVGKVYLVREKKTDKLFAMKVLSKREMIKRNKIKRALAEQVWFFLDRISLCSSAYSTDPSGVYALNRRSLQLQIIPSS